MPRGRLGEILQEPLVEDGGESADQTGSVLRRNAG